MKYLVGHVAQLAGISQRTLRHYEDIGLLVPQRASNGYRSYTDADIDRLQLILLYRELEVPLDRIAELLDNNVSYQQVFAQQRQALIGKIKRLKRVLALIDQTLEVHEKGQSMSAQEKLDPFVKAALQEHEARYGDEARARWGADHYEQSRRKLATLSEDEYRALMAEGQAIVEALAAAKRAGEKPQGAAAQELVARHYAHLQHFGDFYTLEVLFNLGQMYVADERFAATYNAAEPGLAAWFSEAIEQFCVDKS